MWCRWLFGILLFSTGATAQYKSFIKGVHGDSINKVDMNNLKQGKWVIRVAPLRGNPGYEEEGYFKDDLKQGTWKSYNLMGDKIAEEVFRNGNKDGRCTYYSVAGMIREEFWRAPRKLEQQYDTIMVPDPGTPNKYNRVIIRNEGHSIKHGTWRYFDPVYGKIIAEEKYYLDDLVVNKTEEMEQPVDTSAKKRQVLPKIPEAPRFGSKSRNKSVIQ
ncbi:MAG: hypothetical protein WCO43_09785 [Chitinophagia bacterium]|jgi:hypothetical protein